MGPKSPHPRDRLFPTAVEGLALTAGPLPLGWYPGDVPRFHSGGYLGLVKGLQVVL